MSFYDSLEVGKTAELKAEQYFNDNGFKYTDVRNDKQYQLNDIDYIVEGLGTVEVKQNLTDAMKGRQGRFIWIELSVGNKDGWWYKSTTDYFLFFNCDNDFILIPNNETFKNIVNDAIENGDHSEIGINRFDYKYDKRYNRFIKATCMRLYLDILKTKMRIIKRK